MAKKKKLSGYYVFYLPLKNLYWGVERWDEELYLIFNEEDIERFKKEMKDDPSLEEGRWITLEEVEEKYKNVSEI